MNTNHPSHTTMSASSDDASQLYLFHDTAEVIAGIVQELRLRTVLHLGCDKGLLVGALRQRGIESWGIDDSEDNIQAATPEAKPYCRAGDLAAPFPNPRYDLVVCAPALTNLPPGSSETIIANLCQHTSLALVALTPADDLAWESWVNHFLQHGFVPEAGFEATGAVLFRHSPTPPARVLASYIQSLWQQRQENAIRRAVNIEQRQELVQKEANRQQELAELHSELHTRLAEKDTLLAARNAESRSWRQAVEAVRAERDAILNSTSWRLITRVQRIRERLIPVGSRRETLIRAVVRGLRRLLRRQVASPSPAVPAQPAPLPAGVQLITVDEIPPLLPAPPRQAAVDIIICIPAISENVRRCLEALLLYTAPPYSLTLVADGCSAEDDAYLVEFTQQNPQTPCTLIHNEQAQGYTAAANQGLQAGAAEFAVLLDCNAVVTPGWVDRLVACAQSNPAIGLVGPLTNAAEWQSISISNTGLTAKLLPAWAGNPLPAGIYPSHVCNWLAQYSPRLYPRLPTLDGFCLLLRRHLLDEVGLLDEEHFPSGVGADTDYSLRARHASWQLALADDAYVYLAQSAHPGGMNYRITPQGDALRRQPALRQQAAQRLADKHGREILEGTVLHQDRLLQGLRARAIHFRDRQKLLQRGRDLYAGKRILFVLPIAAAGGGAFTIILAAKIMRQMGIDAQIFNLSLYRPGFELAYPDNDVPVIYGEISDLPPIAASYDAAVASSYITVHWLAPAASLKSNLPLGYYIQDYEPYFDEPGTEGHQRAADSYSLLPNLVRCCTTQWIAGEIQRHHGLTTTLIGPSDDIDLFQPRPRRDPAFPQRPLRVAAMVRPSTPRRNTRLTMEVLQRLSLELGDQVEVIIFGADLEELLQSQMPMSFPFKLTGRLGQKQVASLLNEVDIFVDYSTFQGLGMTAIEALSCGVAAIVPQLGGASEFARHEENCLVVDTHDPEASFAALRRLVTDHELRLKLQQNGLFDAPQYYPELPTFKLLEALFRNNKGGQT